MYGLPGMMSAHFHSRDYIPEVAAPNEPAVTPVADTAPATEDAGWDDIPF